MAEDKFAPKANDNADAIHKLHKELIKSQQEENKKAREHANKSGHVEPAKPEDPKAKDANPTQPPAVQAPQNPEAPQNKPVEDKPHE